MAGLPPTPPNGVLSRTPENGRERVLSAGSMAFNGSLRSRSRSNVCPRKRCRISQPGNVGVRRLRPLSSFVPSSSSYRALRFLLRFALWAVCQKTLTSPVQPCSLRSLRIAWQSWARGYLNTRPSSSQSTFDGRVFESCSFKKKFVSLSACVTAWSGLFVALCGALPYAFRIMKPHHCRYTVVAS